MTRLPAVATGGPTKTFSIPGGRQVDYMFQMLFGRNARSLTEIWLASLTCGSADKPEPPAGQ